MTLSERDPKQQEPVAAPAVVTDADGEEVRCTACSTGRLAREKANIAIWQGERLVVVDGISALVCQSCGEQYYEDQVAMKLDLMRGTGFPPDKATHSITVPVFQFDAPEGGQADE